MGLERIGVQAIVENIGGYLSDIDKMNKATGNAADQTEKAATKSEALSKALAGIGKVVAALGLTGAFAGIMKETVDFDKSLHNIQATAGLTQKAIDEMGSTILKMSKNSAYNANELASAMYDIVGGVQDASKWTAILDQSVRMATAGQANLKATTSGLIYIMNAYEFSAKDAAKASDVLTRTVGVGVGTMDDFVSAISPIAVTAKTLKIDFSELGSMMAFLTTKGVSASESATELQSVMQALLKPSGDMKDAIKALGYADGSTMLKTLGFTGTLKALYKQVGGNSDAIAKMFQRVEGFKGVLALTNPDFDTFNKNFQKGVKGATALAQTIQEGAIDTKIDKLKSSINALAIEVGQSLIPSLSQGIDRVSKFLSSLGPAAPILIEIVGAISLITLAIGPLGAMLGVILSPIGAIIAAAGALYLAFQTNFLGIRDLVQSVWNFIQPIITDIRDIITGIFSGVDVESSLADIGRRIKSGLEIMLSKIGIDYRIVDKVTSALTSVSDWFTKTALPAVLDFITNTVIPGIQEFIDTLARIWSDAQPFLNDLYNWFVNEALPTIGAVIANFQANIAEPLIRVLAGIWDAVKAALTNLYDWFVTSGLPAIKGIANDFYVKVLQPLVELLTTIWSKVKQPLESLAQFFVQNGPTIGFVVGVVIGGAFQIVIGIIREFITVIGDAITKLNDLIRLSQTVNFKDPGSTLGFVQAISNIPILRDFLHLPANLGMSRDSGGPGVAGQPYMIGRGAQPELFVPSVGGQFFPRIDQLIAQASPVAGAASYAYNNVYNQQQSQGDINMYNIDGAQDAMRRYSLLRAMGRVR